ncbi:MAG: NfeD family protein [Coriobacteriales bacterium]|nr:NfeD family protein [Coriobacteriales bacterium]
MVLTLLWLGAAIVLGLIEAAAPALVCLWFCLGAVITFIASFFVTEFWIQFIIFTVASLIMLAALRPFMKKRVNVKGEAATNSDAYVGKDVVVTQAIPEGQKGRVRLGDVSWIATTQDGSALATGSHAIVASVDGTVLVVKAAE